MLKWHIHDIHCNIKNDINFAIFMSKLDNLGILNDWSKMWMSKDKLQARNILLLLLHKKKLWHMLWFQKRNHYIFWQKWRMTNKIISLSLKGNFFYELSKYKGYISFHIIVHMLQNLIHKMKKKTILNQILLKV